MNRASLEHRSPGDTTHLSAASVSIVIPTLNESEAIGKTLTFVRQLSGNYEVLVVDGGSRDGTIVRARGFDVPLIVAARGRGFQMHVGATATQGEVLWFLHADTHPPADSIERILAALENPAVVGGHFTLAFDGESGPARFLTWLYPNLRKLGLCYGDSAFFVRRRDYEAVGGFKSFPIFEDLDLLRRLRKRGQFVRLPHTVITSSRRFEGRSFTWVFARWTFLQVLYWLGVPPTRLGQLYAPIRCVDQKPAQNPA